MTFPLAVTTEQGWRPGIGDPSIIGWVTVVGYFIVAWMCLRAAKATAKQTPPTVRPAIWFALAAVMVVLGVNKQLDLQSWLTQLGKQIARHRGWYDHRQTLEAIFIAALAALLLLVTGLFAWFTRPAWHGMGLALAGVVFLLGFVLVRVTSFHHVDLLLGWGLEAGGNQNELAAGIGRPRLHWHFGLAAFNRKWPVLVKSGERTIKPVPIGRDRLLLCFAKLVPSCPSQARWRRRRVVSPKAPSPISAREAVTGSGTWEMVTIAGPKALSVVWIRKPKSSPLSTSTHAKPPWRSGPKLPDSCVKAPLSKYPNRSKNGPSPSIVSYCHLK